MHACAAVMRHHRSATKENNAACLLAYFPCLPEREGRAVCTQSSFLVKRRRPQPVLLRVGGKSRVLAVRCSCMGL